MKDQLISFETAKSAKEKGLLNPTLYFYGEDGKLYTYSSERMTFNDEETKWEAPTQSLLQKWLREKYFISIEIFLDYGPSWGVFVYQSDKDGAKKDCIYGNQIGLFNTYEEALEIGLQQALKLIK